MAELQTNGFPPGPFGPQKDPIFDGFGPTLGLTPGSHLGQELSNALDGIQFDEILNFLKVHRKISFLVGSGSHWEV